MNYFKRRNLKKVANETLRHARHVRNMREDIMSQDDLNEIAQVEGVLKDLLAQKQFEKIESAIEHTMQTLSRIAPQIGGGGLRENFEIFVVAIVIAMGLRTYFIQPFKIPTGSMQPTLYGVTSVQKDSPGITDRYPLKLVKFALFGEWYSVCRAKAEGTLSLPKASPTDPTALVYTIAGVPHKIPRDAVEALWDPSKRYDLKYRTGQFVKKGAVLWSGIVTRGDHVFVNKMIWNFRKPKRGEIMVFYTTGIKSLPPGTHYIKRMCGLPGETISIDPPNLVVNGKIVRKPATIARVENNTPGSGYAGYRLEGNFTSKEYKWKLGDTEYFAMGDNTRNSRDSRYWGSVPAKNLVGPATLIYWPLSKRWGLAH